MRFLSEQPTREGILSGKAWLVASVAALSLAAACASPDITTPATAQTSPSATAVLPGPTAPTTSATPKTQEGKLFTSPETEALDALQAEAPTIRPDFLMTFIDSPTDLEEARATAQENAITLKAIDAHGEQPLVIFEAPWDEAHGLGAGFTRYVEDVAAGTYDTVLTEYFMALKEQGITKESIGKFVVAPEFNMPNTGPVPDVRTWAQYVTKAALAQQKTFPGSTTSILLNAESYPPGTENWDDARTDRLPVYAKALKQESDRSGKNLHFNVGVQAMPWLDEDASPADARHVSDSIPAVPVADVVEAARVLGAGVWVHGGAIKSRRLANGEVLQIPKSKRLEMLQILHALAAGAQKAGVSCTFSVFAEDKLRGDEGIDWKIPAGELAAALERAEKQGMQTALFVQ